MSDALVFGVGLRLVALVQLIAFHSLWRDVLGLAGSRGVTPVAPVLAAFRRDLGWLAFLRAPSLLHLSASDRALRRWILLGAAGAMASLVGGPQAPWGSAVAWVVYLSYDVAVDLLYPWDAMLLEAGFLACFAPALLPLPALATCAAPHPVLVWAYRFLAFRVVFGFGKFKFFGPGKLHTGYLKSFLVTQPMPRPLALRLQRLPLPLHQAALVGLFVVEVLAPWLWLGGPNARWVATALVAALMLAIQATGNFGFFNVGTAAVAVLAATPTPSAFDLSSSRPPPLLDAPHALGVALLVAGTLHLPFNSWVARSWTYWPDLARVGGGVLRPLLAVLRSLAPFRLVHAYGVFGPECGPRGSWVPCFEASRDGERWEPYRYRHYPSDCGYRGTSISPCFPRFDHALIYEAMGLGLGNLFGSVVGGGNPYRATRALFLQRVQLRLLEASPEVLALFAHAPFGAERPREVRVSFRFQALDESAREITLRPVSLGLHLPARTLASAEPIEVPEPTAFLPDDRVWTRRAIGRGRASDLAPTPTLSWMEGASVAEAIERGDRDRAEMRAAEGALFRAAWLLRARARPAPGEGEIELWLRSLRAASRGAASVARALEDPQAALERESWREGLRVLAALRPDWVRFHARKARLRELTLRGASAAPPPFAPGILRLLPSLAAEDPDPTPLPRLERVDTAPLRPT